MGKGGEASDPIAAGNLQDDAAYTPFLQDSFDATEFASNALAGSHTTAQAQTRMLQDRIQGLQLSLREEVLHRRPEVLQQAAQLRDSETAMQGINLAVETVQSALQRAKALIMEPYSQLQLEAQQLRNLHSTVEMLRHVIQRLKLVAKLKQQIDTKSGGYQDLAKSAKLLADIDTIGSEADLAGIDVIEADSEFLHSTWQDVQGQAEVALQRGIETLSQAEVGSALQVYFNLGLLRKAVSDLLDHHTRQFGSSIKDILDPKKLSVGAGSPASTPEGSRPGHGHATTKWQEHLWQKLGVLMERLRVSIVAVWHMQRVLAKKRDPLTHVLFIDECLDEKSPMPSEHLWTSLTTLLMEGLAVAAAPVKGGFIREALTTQYPRLAALLEEIFRRVVHDTDVKGVMPAVTAEQQAELIDTAAPFQNAYLGASLTRMSDAVTAAFPGTSRTLTSSAELQKCIARMHDEVRVVADSPRLSALTAKTVGKALQLMAEKAEYMTFAGPEMRQVGGPSSSGQQRNMRLCSQLQEVHRSLLTLLPRLQPPAAAALMAPLQAVQAVAIEAVMPIFKAMVEAAEEIILRLHIEGFADGGQQGMTQASAYMQALITHLTHCRAEYLSQFHPAPSPQVPSFVSALTERMACRVLVFFVRHASLVRPLSNEGKLRLAKDMGELEAGVGQSVYPLDHLGLPFNMLRAFRRLLFLDTAEVMGSPLVRELPAIVVLHHLYSRAPAELQSPHVRQSFTPAQYSLWLDQHSMSEALKFIKGALSATAAKVDQDDACKELVGVMTQICNNS
ncbi:hypothetical protein WJX77_008098 [Trebouxia sp. C0004]